MIVWINGSFGAGKMTLAGVLRRRCPGSVLFDPEDVGFMLRDALASADDFQDVPAWRELVVQAGRILAQLYRLVIVPMTFGQLALRTGDLRRPGRA